MGQRKARHQTVCVGNHWVHLCTLTLLLLTLSWASCQIRKIAGCACAGNAGNVFPGRRFRRKPLVSDPGMHHGTCVTHVPWCMTGSLTCGDGENVPGIPGACAPAILRIWQETHGAIYLDRFLVLSYKMPYTGKMFIDHTSWTWQIDKTFAPHTERGMTGLSDISMVDQSVPPLHHTVTKDNAILTFDFGIIVPGRSGNILLQYAK